MKINLTKEDLQKLLDLFQTREINMDISSMYLYYLTNESTSIKEKNVSRWMKDRKLSVDRAFYYEFLNVLELDHKDKYYMDANKQCKVSDIKQLDPNVYTANPYYQTIKVPEVKSKSWYFKYDTIEAYEGFMYDDLFVDAKNNYAENSRLGFFTKPYKYLSVTQGDEIWMCVTPHEMNTMAPSIEEARGNVLVYGLGLGYFPFMVSNKFNVNKITIIEKDKNAIELFTKYILPQFPNKDKISVVEADAFEYTKNHDIASSYNYAFVDLWHNVEDGIPLYLMMKKLTKGNTKTRFSYWIEESLLVYLRRLLLTLIDEVADGADESNYVKELNQDDHVVNRMYQVYKEKNITTYEQIYQMLSDESLRHLAEEL